MNEEKTWITTTTPKKWFDLHSAYSPKWKNIGQNKPHRHTERGTEKTDRHTIPYIDQLFIGEIQWINAIHSIHGECDIFALESNEIENAKKRT